MLLVCGPEGLASGATLDSADDGIGLNSLWSDARRESMFLIILGSTAWHLLEVATLSVIALDGIGDGLWALSLHGLLRHVGTADSVPTDRGEILGEILGLHLGATDHNRIGLFLCSGGSVWHATRSLTCLKIMLLQFDLRLGVAFVITLTPFVGHRLWTAILRPV